MDNLFSLPPARSADETFEDVLRHDRVRIERIVSRGHTSPATGWYDQDQNEWVLVLEGAGTIAFEDQSEHRLGKGDHLLIPAHTRHRVTWTDPDQPTLWLAVHFS